MNFRAQVLTGLRWTTGAKLVGQLFNWTITIIVIRLLVPEDYGLMAMAMAVIALLNLVNEMGMGAAIIQRRTLETEMLRRVLGLVILVNLALFAALYLAAPMLAAFFAEPRLIEVVQILSVQFVLIGISVIPQSLLEKRMAFKERSLVELIATTGGSLATLWFALVDMGVWALVYGNLVRAGIRALGLNLASPFLHLPNFNLAGIGKLASFGGLVTVERVLWYLYTEADVFIIGRLLGSELLGVYAVARHLASLPSQKLNSVITQVSLPAFAAIQDERERFAAYLVKATRVLSMVAFPLFFGIAAVAPELVRVFLGGQWEAAIVPMQIIALAMPLRMVGANIPTAVKAAGRPDINVMNLSIACVIVPGGFLIGANWGLLGVSMAWLIAYPVAFGIGVARARRATGVSLRSFAAANVRAAAISVLMYAAVVAGRALIPDDATPLIVLTALTTIGVSAYTALSAIFNREDAKEVFALARGR